MKHLYLPVTIRYIYLPINVTHFVKSILKTEVYVLKWAFSGMFSVFSNASH